MCALDIWLVEQIRYTISMCTYIHVCTYVTCMNVHTSTIHSNSLHSVLSEHIFPENNYVYIFSYSPVIFLTYMQLNSTSVKMCKFTLIQYKYQKNLRIDTSEESIGCVG